MVAFLLAAVDFRITKPGVKERPLYVIKLGELAAAFFMDYVVHNIEHLQKRALNHYDFTNADNPRSVTNGEYDKFGAMGEVFVNELFKPFYPIEYKGTFDYDFLINGRKFEVKTEVVKFIPPRKYWVAKILETSLHQQTDYYLFVAVTKKMKYATVCGHCSKAFFMNHAEPKKKGEVFADLIRGPGYREDCRILPHERLRKFKDERLNMELVERKLAGQLALF